MRYFTLLCIFLLFSGSGCDRLRVPFAKERGSALEGERRAALLARLSEQEHCVRTYRGLAQVNVRYGSRQERLRHLLMAEKPDKFRIETFPPNAFYALGVLIGNGGRVISLDPGHKEAWQGDNASSLIHTALRVPVNEKELVSLITGAAGAAVSSSDGNQLSLSPDGQHVTWSDATASRFWRLRADNLQLSEVYFQDEIGGRAALYVKYLEFKEFNGCTLPTSIEILLPKDKLTISMELGKITANASIEPSYFDLKIPQGFSITRR